MSRFRGRQRRPRGQSSWYDSSMSALADQEERIEIPPEKVGLVIGRQGRRLKEIREECGVQIFIKDTLAHLRGTAEQVQRAKNMIEEILNTNNREERTSFKKLENLLIPQHVIGKVLGKGRERLRTIETTIGVELKVINDTFYIKGATKKDEKQAERQLKEAANLALKQLQRTTRCTKFVYVDMAQLTENHEFKLTIAPPRRTHVSLGENSYKLELLEHPLKEETYLGFPNVDRIKEKVVEVLRQIHGEKREEEVMVDMWCHFGHAYITKIDEDELEETFTLKEVQEKLEIKTSRTWKSLFIEGVEDMEVEGVEKHLPSKASKEDIRHDFTFYTPSCRDVRVKAWLMETEGEAASAMAFSRGTPITVKNILTRVVSDERGDTSDTPCFHICYRSQNRLNVDILIPSKDLDCRLSIKTCNNYAPKTPQDEEEDKILEDYLMGMKIEGGQLSLRPASELQEGFDLFYKRRSLRKTYQYEMDGEQFSLTVCKDQATNVCPYEPDASNIDEIPAKADIHLHCEEWDRLLNEGNWEPDQIADKLPAFLKFLRQVQSSVAVSHG